MRTVRIAVRLVSALTGALALTVAALAPFAPASAQDLNAFRRAHGLNTLSISGPLSSAAYAHAHDMANRNHLDHRGFKQRLGALASTAAENVAVIACARPDAKPRATFAGRACGCDSESCAFKMWERSAGHRRNMLMRGVSSYGIASASAANGRKYWVLVLGNN